VWVGRQLKRQTRSKTHWGKGKTVQKIVNRRKKNGPLPWPGSAGVRNSTRGIVSYGIRKPFLKAEVRKKKMRIPKEGQKGAGKDRVTPEKEMGGKARL